MLLRLTKENTAEKMKRKKKKDIFVLDSTAAFASRACSTAYWCHKNACDITGLFCES